jgi:hypothetical protein
MKNPSNRKRKRGKGCVLYTSGVESKQWLLFEMHNGNARAINRDGKQHTLLCIAYVINGGGKEIDSATLFFKFIL